MKASKSLIPLLIAIVLIYLLVPDFLVQAFCVTLFFLILISFFYALIIKKNLSVERYSGELKLFCKERTKISFTIRNYSLLPVFVCHYTDNAPHFYVFQNKNTGLVSLRARQKIRIDYEVYSQDRGEYIIGPAVLKFYDPLFLFTITKEIHSELKIIVRPQRLKLITVTVPGIPQGGLKINNPVYEDITLKRTVREYKNQDEPKRINWRISAKFQKLFTNEYDNSYNAPFFIFLNLARDDYDFHTNSIDMEKAIEIAACIVEKADYLRQAVGFASYAEKSMFLLPENNQGDAIMDILSLIKPADGKLPYDPVKQFKSKLKNNTLFFSIGPQEVRWYSGKVLRAKENINTENTGIRKS
ncbi:MAG: DUF58 domain-containing protein [Treponema sp.]|nr:DUF58 domain-containing protein [Treponema sp.]